MQDLKVEFKLRSHVSIAELNPRLERAARYMVSSTQDKIQRGIPPANAALTVALKGSSKPLTDTGALLSSITSRTDGDKAVIGTNRIGARINQFGGTITPKKGAWLWIPASKQVKTELRNCGGSITRLIRFYKQKGYSFFASRSGKLFLARREKEVIRFFIRKKSVVIPARPFLYFSDDDIRVVKEMFRGLIEKDSGSDEQPS